MVQPCARRASRSGRLVESGAEEVASSEIHVGRVWDGKRKAARNGIGQ